VDFVDEPKDSGTVISSRLPYSITLLSCIEDVGQTTTIDRSIVSSNCLATVDKASVVVRFVVGPAHWDRKLSRVDLYQCGRANINALLGVCSKGSTIRPCASSLYIV
jgi:hypothetical protein